MAGTASARTAPPSRASAVPHLDADVCHAHTLTADATLAAVLRHRPLVVTVAGRGGPAGCARAARLDLAPLLRPRRALR